MSVTLSELELVEPPTEADRFSRACAAGDLAAVTEALRDKPDLGPLDNSGLTPLHYAIGLWKGDWTDSVELLVAAGADINARLDDPSVLRDGLTARRPLGIARALDKPTIAAFLKDAGAVE